MPCFSMEVWIDTRNGARLGQTPCPIRLINQWMIGTSSGDQAAPVTRSYSAVYDTALQKNQHTGARVIVRHHVLWNG